MVRTVWADDHLVEVASRGRRHPAIQTLALAASRGFVESGQRLVTDKVSQAATTVAP